jgi:hypothetical protein
LRPILGENNAQAKLALKSYGCWISPESTCGKWNRTEHF